MKLLLGEISLANYKMLLKCRSKTLSITSHRLSKLLTQTFKIFNNFQPTKKPNSYFKNPLSKDKTYHHCPIKKNSLKWKNRKESNTLILKRKLLNIKGLHNMLVQIKNNIAQDQSILERKIRKTIILKEIRI